MQNNGKILITILFLSIINISFSMDEQGENRSNPIAMRHFSEQFNTEVLPLSQSPAQSSTMFSLPSPMSLTSYASSSLAKLTRTVKNVVSDDEAFVLLGWPLENFQAVAELQRTRSIYRQVGIEDNPQIRYEYLHTILNRTTYLLRVYKSLPYRSDSVALAEHCVKEHSCAMNESLKNLFAKYLREKEAESVRAHQSAQKKLLKDSNQQLQNTAQKKGTTIVAGNTKKELSDGDILLRIGWAAPDREHDAQLYLQKCIAVYKIKENLRTEKGREWLQTDEARKSLTIAENYKVLAMINDMVRCRKFVDRRESYISRIYALLLSRHDALQLAVHCLKYHAYVMSKSRQEDFTAFVEERQRFTNAICEQIFKKNTDIIDDEKKDTDKD